MWGAFDYRRGIIGYIGYQAYDLFEVQEQNIEMYK
jgi:hypothetical protein